MSRDPHILARKFLDRWMVRALGVGLYDRPVWRRETEDLRRLLRATTLPKRKVAAMGSVVRAKSAPLGPGGSEGGRDTPPLHGGEAGEGVGGKGEECASVAGPRPPLLCGRPPGLRLPPRRRVSRLQGPAAADPGPESCPPHSTAGARPPPPPSFSHCSPCAALPRQPSQRRRHARQQRQRRRGDSDGRQARLAPRARRPAHL
jgi:hypothetical protein